MILENKTSDQDLQHQTQEGGVSLLQAQSRPIAASYAALGYFGETDSMPAEPISPSCGWVPPEGRALNLPCRRQLPTNWQDPWPGGGAGWLRRSPFPRATQSLRPPQSLACCFACCTPTAEQPPEPGRPHRTGPGSWPHSPELYDQVSLSPAIRFLHNNTSHRR